jgi:hypothetical protein
MPHTNRHREFQAARGKTIRLPFLMSTVWLIFSTIQLILKQPPLALTIAAFVHQHQ